MLHLLLVNHLFERRLGVDSHTERHFLWMTTSGFTAHNNFKTVLETTPKRGVQ